MRDERPALDDSTLEMMMMLMTMMLFQGTHDFEMTTREIGDNKGRDRRYCTVEPMTARPGTMSITQKLPKTSLKNRKIYFESNKKMNKSK